MAWAGARLRVAARSGPLAPSPCTLPTAHSVERSPLPIACRRWAMTSISGSEHASGRLPLGRFISSGRFSHSEVQRNRQRAAHRRAPGVGLGQRPLGLAMSGGVGLLVSSFQHDLCTYTGAPYIYRSACARCCGDSWCRSGAKRRVNYESLLLIIMILDLLIPHFRI